MTEREIHKIWDDRLSAQFVDKVLENKALFDYVDSYHYNKRFLYLEEKILSFTYKLMQSENHALYDADDMMEQLEGCVLDGMILSDRQQADLEDLAEDMASIINDGIPQNEVKSSPAQRSYQHLREKWYGKLPKDIVDLFVDNAELFEDQWDQDRLDQKILKHIYLCKEVRGTDKDYYDYDDWMDRLDQLAKEDRTSRDEAVLKKMGEVVDRFLNSITKEEKIRINRDDNQRTANHVEKVVRTQKRTIVDGQKASEKKQPTRTIDSKPKPPKESQINGVASLIMQHKQLCLILLGIFFIWIFWGYCDNKKGTKDQESVNSALATDFEENEELSDPESTDQAISVEDYLEKEFDNVIQYETYYEIGRDGKYGLADLKGNITIEPNYDFIGVPNMELGYFEVRKNNKYGLVSLATLKEVLPPKYDNIGYPSEKSKTVEIREGSKYGLFSTETFELIAEPVYDHIGLYEEETGLLKVRKGSKYGLYSPSKKKEVAPCIYDYIYFSGNLYKVRVEDKYGYLNKDGSLNKNLQ